MRKFLIGFMAATTLTVGGLYFSGVVTAQDTLAVFKTKITNDDETRVVDVVLQSGLNKIPVIADVNVVSTASQGRDNNPDTWCRVDTAGDIGDTITVTIPDDSCTVVTTLTATEAGDAIATVDLMISDFQANGTCSALYEVVRVKDNPVMMVAAFLIDGIAERPDAGDFNCDPTGTTDVTEGFDNIVSREKLVKITPDKDDPRVGATNISGIIIQIPGGVSDLIIASFLNSSASPDMIIDCDPFVAGTCEFDIPCSNDKDRFLNEIRIFGGCGGVIKFAQFLCNNNKLTNGIEVSIQSDGEMVTFPLLKSTEDIKNRFSFGPAGPGGQFRIDDQPGAGQITGALSFQNPAVIKKCTGSNDDFAKIKIQDDMTTLNLQELEGVTAGFERDP